MSLVRRHQSNGVERTHREILRFLSMLVGDERLANVWSRPQVIGVIQFLLNSQVSAETGFSPFDFLFGTLDAKWLRLPEVGRLRDASSEFLRALDGSIEDIRQAALGVLKKVQEKRLKAVSNGYQVGDFVLVDAKAMDWRKGKLAPRFFGPYLVDGKHMADVDVRHLVTGDVKRVHMEHLKPYFSDSFDDAYKAALVDHSQFVMDTIVSWSGDPETRSKMSFLVRFVDGDELWLPYGKDLCESQTFIVFCERNAPLLPLLYSEREWRSFAARMDREQIEGWNLASGVWWISERGVGIGLVSVSYLMI
jgi:hypothetical protein